MPDSDHVRARGSETVNPRVDRETLRRLRHYADVDRVAITPRMHALDREWDVERALDLNAAIIGLAGLVLGVARDRRWLAVPGIVFSFLALHALRGRCPPVSALRRMGVRTRREIEREKYALKGLRGDFDGAAGRSQAAWRSVRH
ncbi:MAG: hypothetical protein ABJC33_03445 [Betaproteobacteria bacterium]